MMPSLSGKEFVGSESGRESLAESAIMSMAPLILLLLTILVFLVRGSVFSPSPLVIGMQLLALGLVLAARFTFGKQQFNVTAHPGEGPLIERGPYRFIRHPMYAGSLLFVWACVLGHWSYYNAGAGILLSVLLPLRIVTEERLLRKRYAEYGPYASRTKRLIPFVF
jgi:protein-S-isoprenylcysteine O-methyltransferase Ste14